MRIHLGAKECIQKSLSLIWSNCFPFRTNWDWAGTARIQHVCSDPSGQMRIHWYWWGPTWHNEDPLGLPVIHQNPFWAMRVHKDPLGSIRTNLNPFGSTGIHKHSSISFTFILLNDFLEIWSIIVVYVTIDGSLHGSHILAYLGKKTVKILVPEAQFWYPIYGSSITVGEAVK